MRRTREFLATFASASEAIQEQEARTGLLRRIRLRPKAGFGGTRVLLAMTGLAILTHLDVITLRMPPTQTPAASITASAKACGASCGRLCPIPPLIRRWA